MVTECTEGCGACCHPLVLPYNRIEAMTNPQISLEQRQWAERSLRPMSRRVAFQIAPWWEGKLLRDQFGNLVEPCFFYCAHYDEETARCTDYEDRPYMCAGYPWYGDEPYQETKLPPTCSYRADIGEVPVAITRKPS